MSRSGDLPKSEPIPPNDKYTQGKAAFGFGDVIEYNANVVG
jgi:hypothetical protein